MRPSALPVCCCGGYCHRAVQPPGELIMNRLKQSLSFLLSFCLVLTTAPRALAYQADQTSAQVPLHTAKEAAAQLQQLEAPIALYPDSLVAQILAAATYSDQDVYADRSMQQNP